MIATARLLVRSMIGLDQIDRDVDHPCPSRSFEEGAPGGNCVALTCAKAVAR